MMRQLWVCALVITLVGCAVPPDKTAAEKAVAHEERFGNPEKARSLRAMLNDLEVDLKRQEGKLFKNYDHAKELVEAIAKGNIIEVAVSDTQQAVPSTAGTFNVGSTCIEGYKFAYSGTGSIAAFIDERGRGIPCK
jgi:hypothetical protein